MFVLGGCTTHNENRLKGTEIIHVVGLEKVKEVPASIFKLSPEKAIKKIESYRMKIPVDNIIKYCEYIKLENLPSAGIGSIDKIEIKKDRIYILDINNAKALFVFNADGSFNFKISRLGKGPGEYFKISDFSILENGNIEIFDKNLKKVMHFDKEGNFLKESSFNYWVKGYTRLGDAKYLFYTGFRDNPNISKDKLYNIITTDSQFKILSKDFSFNSSIKNIGYGASLVFTRYKNNIIYKPALDNNVYSLGNDGKFYSKYYIEFGDYKLPAKYIESATFENRGSAIDHFRQKKYAKNISNVRETDNYLIFHFSFRNKILTGYYNKKSKELIYGDGFTENSIGLYSVPKGTVNEKFIYIFEPYFIYQHPYKEKVIDGINKSNKDLGKKMEGWKLESNPIIVIATPK